MRYDAIQCGAVRSEMEHNAVRKREITALRFVAPEFLRCVTALVSLTHQRNTIQCLHV
ncbi:MAG: hypothetical protein J07HQX50_01847 [Haloquadratum sp. J07HQX50]|nr:MAG: hypothetical protein J07HQX50_01847 [Haloquadratum sp. J07HQX50]